MLKDIHNALPTGAYFPLCHSDAQHHVVVALAYRTPTRRFRGLLCVGRSEEHDERGDAAEAAERRAAAVRAWRVVRR